MGTATLRCRVSGAPVSLSECGPCADLGCPDRDPAATPRRGPALIGARVRWNHPHYYGADLFGTVLDAVEPTYLHVRWDSAPDPLDPSTHLWVLLERGFLTVVEYGRAA